MLIVILGLVLSNSQPNSIFLGQIWVEKVKFFTLPGSCYTEYLKDVIVKTKRKVWKQRWKWTIVSSACYSYSFIAAKSKNWSNQQNDVEIINYKWNYCCNQNLPYQKSLASTKLWNKNKTEYKSLHNGPSI